MSYVCQVQKRTWNDAARPLTRNLRALSPNVGDSKNGWSEQSDRDVRIFFFVLSTASILTTDCSAQTQIRSTEFTVGELQKHQSVNSVANKKHHDPHDREIPSISVSVAMLQAIQVSIKTEESNNPQRVGDCPISFSRKALSAGCRSAS